MALKDSESQKQGEAVLARREKSLSGRPSTQPDVEPVILGASGHCEESRANGGKAVNDETKS